MEEDLKRERERNGGSEWNGEEIRVLKWCLVEEKRRRKSDREREREREREKVHGFYIGLMGFVERSNKKGERFERDFCLCTDFLYEWTGRSEKSGKVSLEEMRKRHSDHCCK